MPDEEKIRDILKKYLPIADGEFLTLKACLYTNTSDEDFIIDHLPAIMEM